MRTYNPQDFEKKWQEKWYSSDIYSADDFSKKPKYYILSEFPYTSGEGVHIGHCKTYTMTDVMARHARMHGKNVLYPMGWDAFGLPTENYAIKTKINPKIITKENIANFKKQMQMMGWSFDWSREIDTTEPRYIKWTQWIFLKMFEKGLAYKDQMPINWCPKCKTGLANEEVVNGKHERCGSGVTTKILNQWMLKITAYADRLADELEGLDYSESIVAAERNWIGRKEWIDITYPIDGTEETIVVSTTRPDTNFGATFVVLAPEHPILDPEKGLVPREHRAQVDEYIKATQSKTEDERIAEGREKTGVFAGLYCVNQLNDAKMPIYVTDFVLMSVGTGAVVGVPGHDRRDFEFAQKFGLPVVRVVKGPSGDESPITKIEHVQEEEGIIMNSGFLDGLDVHDATKKVMDYLEGKGWGKRVIRYHLRDWLFSRQHYWGEPIPIIHCEECGAVPVPYEDLPVELPDVKSYEPTETGESPLAVIGEWVNVTCPKCNGPAKRETDTMPNWAGSSWYYCRFCDPDCADRIADPKILDYWMPVDFYDGGAEHVNLHLLYSRFWYKFLGDIGIVPGVEPYKSRRNHGMLLGEGGVKMSKSIGNVINPDELVKKYGTDVLRLYLLFVGPYDGTSEWSFRAIQGVDRFVKRFWEMMMRNIEGKTKSCKPEFEKSVHQLVRTLDRNIPNRRFNTSVAALMEFYNAVKDGALCIDCLEQTTKAVAPLMPHLAEELWSDLGHTESVHREPWPEVKEESKDEMVEIPVQVGGKIRGRITVPTDASENAVVAVALEDDNVKKHLEGKQPSRTVYVPGKIVTLVV
jgi:leucyl-tRNA synthetase